MNRFLASWFVIEMFLLLPSLTLSAEEPELPTEIEVISPRTLLHFRQEVTQAEEVVHSVWNDLNDDDLFDIRCVWEARTGTTIKRRRCAPRFVDELTEDHASEYLSQARSFDAGIGGTAYPDDTQAMRRNYTLIFQQKMKDMAEQNAELLEAITNHANSLERLKSAQEAAFQDD